MRPAVQLFVVAEVHISSSTCSIVGSGKILFCGFANAFLMKMDAVLMPYSLDYGCVWFMPRVAPPKHWPAKILVEVLVAHDLANIGKKNELELARVH